jgi:hypothetical protein
MVVQSTVGSKPCLGCNLIPFVLHVFFARPFTVLQNFRKENSYIDASKISKEVFSNL